MSLHSRDMQFMAQASVLSFATADLTYLQHSDSQYEVQLHKKPRPASPLCLYVSSGLRSCEIYCHGLPSACCALRSASSKQSLLIAGEKKHSYATGWVHGTEAECCPSHVSSRSWSSTRMFTQHYTSANRDGGNELGCDTGLTW